MLVSLGAIIVLLAANAFFVAAEFALVKARDVRLRDLDEGGNRRARLALRLLGNIEAYLAACQLGITMASLGLGWVGEPVVAALLEPLLIPILHALGLGEATLHSVAFVAGFLLFSSLHIVVGEQVPKTLAIRRADSASLWVAGPLHAFYLVCWPLNWALNETARGLLRLLGVGEAGHMDVYSADELRSLIDTSKQFGAMRKHEHDMLGAVLDLEKVEVAEVMVHRRDIAALNADAPAAETVREVLDGSYTRYPLWSGDPDTIVGVLHAKDVLALAHKRGEAIGGDELRGLAAPPWFVPDTTSLFHQLLAFRQKRAHLAFVVDEYGTLQGLVTLEDILEEIVGDILDEKDVVATAGVRPEADGGALVEGRVTIRDLNRQLDWDLPDDAATTVAGLVMHEARRIPDAGEAFVFHGFRFEVLRRQRHQLTLLRVTFLGEGARASA